MGGEGRKEGTWSKSRSPDPSNWGDGDPCPQFLHFKVIFWTLHQSPWRERDSGSTLTPCPRLLWLLVHSPFHSMDYSGPTSSRDVSRTINARHCPGTVWSPRSLGIARMIKKKTNPKNPKMNHKKKPVGMKRIVIVCVSATSDPQLPEMESFSETSQYHFPTLQDLMKPGESKRLPKVILADVSFILDRFMKNWYYFCLAHSEPASEPPPRKRCFLLNQFLYGYVAI